jgi:hypothetical protein
MRLRELTEGVGRIVKGVNTTVDVGPGEIKKQAAKFGNSVDKDGVPPTLSKRVKGKSTNVLFNLGLSESRVRQLEASYEGNIGIMELMKFFQTAPKELVVQVKQLINQKKDKEVWKIVQQYTGTKLKGKEFETDEDTNSTYNAENFADGKKPGRKGLAKRSGVNTKASVSSLRKTAKNSSGEKQRMAHWLANMKAGRAKKK